MTLTQPATVDDVTVVIPTFNRAADLPRTLEALRLQDIGLPTVLVVDNSSTDNTSELVHALMPVWHGRLHYRRKVPRGPAAARNLGLAEARTNLVLFLDSDVELPSNWLRLALARVVADPGLAALGGFVLYAFDPSRVNAYGGDLGRMGLAWDACEGQALDPQTPAAKRVWINCSAMLARSAAVREVGAFDEDFFYGYEDSDLGWRLCLAGHHVAVFPELRVFHHVDPAVGTAHPQIVFHACKNRLRSLLRNASAATLAPRLLAYAIYVAVDLLLRGPRRQKWAALCWNLRRLRHTLALRAKTQATRRCSDAEIFHATSRRLFPPTSLGNRRRRPSQAQPRQTGPSRAATGQQDDRV